MSATDDAIYTQLKLLPQKWFLTIKKMTMTMSNKKRRKKERKIDNQILRLDTRIELNWMLLGTEHSFNLCESTHVRSQNHKKKKKCHNITHTKKIKENQKIWLKLFACFLHPTHRSSYGFLLLFPFVSLILLSWHFYDFFPFFISLSYLCSNYDCFYGKYICQYLFMYMQFSFIEDLFVSNCIKQF